MAANDVMGKLAFQAPDEGTGTDAILVAAAIQARAEGDFSSSNNATSIDFMTGASEAAATKMTLTSAGRLGVGTVTPDARVDVELPSGVYGVSNPTQRWGYAGVAYLDINNGGSVEPHFNADASSTWDSGTLLVFDYQGTEKMRIKSGGSGGTLFVGGTTVRNAAQVSIDYTSASQCGMGLNDTNSGNGGSHIAFLTGGTVRGAITNNNNSAVAYNTSSDARLKENLVSISDAIGRVNKLNPVKFNWIGSGSVSEGFIAQEILAGDEQLAADMVTGDPDGDAETAPMQVDYAKITPLLTAALQQALAKIDDLETRLIALEG
jgi:hypothetical protein